MAQAAMDQNRMAKTYHLVMTNIAMEHAPVTVDLPFKKW